MPKPRNETFSRDLAEELEAQLACAWEEFAEQVAEQDKSSTAVMQQIPKLGVRFDGETICIQDNDGHLHIFRFNLERIL